MQLAIFTTGRCNAQCTHCTVDSGPRRKQALAPARIFQLMDEAAALAPQGEPPVFGLTGGEVFLDFPLLLNVVAYGASLGARVTCTTNGYWATEDDKARRMLGTLKAAGLRAIAVSTSRFHQRYVSAERVRRVLVFSRELGIHATLKCALTASDRDSGWANQFFASAPHDELQTFPVVPYLRSGASLPETEYLREPGLPEGTCPAPVLTVREDGHAYTCCNPGAFSELLRIGDLNREPMHRVRDRYLTGGVQQVLREEGPIRFAKAAIAQGEGGRLRSAYGGVCDLCADIAADPVLSGIAAAVGEDNDRRHLQAVFNELLQTSRA